MAELHDRFNELHTAGASKADQQKFLDENVPAGDHSKFKTTARQQRSRAAKRATETDEQKSARLASEAGAKATKRAETSGRAAGLDEAHDTISGELGSTPNPVKVEYRPTKDTWTSRFVPPKMVPDLAAAHPGNDMSFTFTDHDGTARQYHTTRGGNATSAPEGHATGGRVMVGTRSPDELSKRAGGGLPTESTEQFSTAGYGNAPFGVTPDVADRFKQTQALIKSQKTLETAQAMPDARIHPQLQKLGESVGRVRDLDIQPLTEQAVKSRGETHQAMMTFDPEYADSVDKAAGDYVTKADAVESAQGRLLETRRNAARRGIQTSTWGGAKPRAATSLGEAGEDLLQAGGGEGFSFEGSRTHTDPVSEVSKDYVYPRSVTPMDRRLRQAYNLAKGVSAGGPQGVGHLRSAEKWAGISFDTPTPQGGRPTLPGDSGLKVAPEHVMEGIRQGVRVNQKNEEGETESVAYHESEQGKQSAELAQMYWQMGKHPMYQGMRDHPEALIETTKALGGRATGGSLPEQATALNTRIGEHEHEQRMSHVIGFPAPVYAKMAKAGIAPENEMGEALASPAAAPAEPKGRALNIPAENITKEDFGRMEAEIKGETPQPTAEATLREKHDTMRNMVRGDLLGAIRQSAADKGILHPRAAAAGQVQMANGPAESAIDGAKAATNRRHQRGV